MFRFLLIVAALAYGMFWASQNMDFLRVKSDMIEGFKKEKTIKAVTQSRSILNENNENAMNQ